MTQEERWNLRYLEVKGFIESNHRNLSKYNLDERQLYTWKTSEEGDESRRVEGTEAGDV